MKNGKLTYEEEEIRTTAEDIATKLFLQVAFDELHLTLEEANDWMIEVCVEAVKNQIVGEIMKHDPEDDFRFVKGATNDEDFQYVMARMWSIFRSNLKKGVYDFSEYSDETDETENDNMIKIDKQTLIEDCEKNANEVLIVTLKNKNGNLHTDNIDYSTHYFSIDELPSENGKVRIYDIYFMNEDYFNETICANSTFEFTDFYEKGQTVAVVAI